MHTRINCQTFDTSDYRYLAQRPRSRKSAFFNRLTETKRALVHDLPGVTRDRLYGEVDWLVDQFTLIDTGGLEPGTEDIIKQHIAAQVETAVEEASVIIFMVDGKIGIHPLDEFIAENLGHGTGAIPAAGAIVHARSQRPGAMSRRSWPPSMLTRSARA